MFLALLDPFWPSTYPESFNIFNSLAERSTFAKLDPARPAKFNIQLKETDLEYYLPLSADILKTAFLNPCCPLWLDKIPTFLE